MRPNREWRVGALIFQTRLPSGFQAWLPVQLNNPVSRPSPLNYHRNTAEALLPIPQLCIVPSCPLFHSSTTAETDLPENARLIDKEPEAG